jgi:hypothetical protein
MTIPKYLEAFRRAARESLGREKSEVSEKRGEGEGLISLNTLISHPEPSQNPSKSDAVCAICGAAKDLWQVGAVLVHQECARFLPRPAPAQPTAAYQSITAEPDGATCHVEIVELPAKGRRYAKVFSVLQLRPPALVPLERWRQAVEDGKCFLSRWGESAEALGWSSADLFSLAPIPKRPRPSYNRLSRYDATGLCWLLEGRAVVALTETTAAIQNTTGAITVYRRHNKPALGPLGDSLEDLEWST